MIRDKIKEKAKSLKVRFKKFKRMIAIVLVVIVAFSFITIGDFFSEGNAPYEGLYKFDYQIIFMSDGNTLQEKIHNTVSIGDKTMSINGNTFLLRCSDVSKCPSDTVFNETDGTLTIHHNTRRSGKDVVISRTYWENECIGVELFMETDNSAIHHLYYNE